MDQMIEQLSCFFYEVQSQTAGTNRDYKSDGQGQLRNIGQGLGVGLQLLSRSS